MTGGQAWVQGCKATGPALYFMRNKDGAVALCHTF